MPLLALPWTEGSSGRRPGWRFGWPRHMTLDHMPARLWRLAKIVLRASEPCRDEVLHTTA